MSTIKTQIPQQTMTYDEYIRKIHLMVSQLETSGPNQTESLVNYTKLNYHRMTRLNKTIKLDDEITEVINDFKGNMLWVVITEAWCGDAAQNLPFIAKLAESAENVDLQMVWRDENIAYIDSHLTNGSRSIPKLIIYDKDTLEEIADWGPRPDPVQKMVMEYKAGIDHQDLPFDRFAEKLHGWYAKNKNHTLRNELFSIFQALEIPKPV